MTERTLPIAPRIIEIDENLEYWRLDDYPEIEAIKGVFVYDKNLDVHICSFTVSRELHAIHAYPIIPKPYDGISQERYEAIRNFIDEHWGEQDVDYSNAFDVDNIKPFKDLALIELPFEEGTYEKEMEELVQQLDSNGVPHLDGSCKGFPNWAAQMEDWQNRMEAKEHENTV